MNTVLEFKNVSKIYQQRKHPVYALEDVSLQIKKGEFVGLIGPSGSGKTTFLVTAGAMLHPTHGEIFFEGESLARKSASALATLRRNKIGFLFQSFNLIPYLDALHNVMAPMMLAGKSEKEQTQRAIELLTRVGLEKRLDHKPCELSVGQMQRVALARMLANDPEFILADEPTGNLDPQTAEEVLSFMKKLCIEEQKTIVMVTHSPDAVKHTSRILTCHHGKIIPQ